MLAALLDPLDDEGQAMIWGETARGVYRLRPS